jgi:hypothetical protein
MEHLFGFFGQRLGQYQPEVGTLFQLEVGSVITISHHPSITSHYFLVETIFLTEVSFLIHTLTPSPSA